MNYRGLVGAVLLLPLLFVAAIAAWDPLGVLWRPEPKAWVMGMRVMAACAIDSGKYDSYVLGSSMLENTSARELENVFPGSRFANISMSGSNFYERSFPLQRLLSDNKAKRIIYSLDTNIFVENMKDEFQGGDARFLYDNIKINNINIYFNGKVIKDILKEYKRKKTEELYAHRNDYNMPYALKENGWAYKCFGKFENWVDQAIAEEKRKRYILKNRINGVISYIYKIADGEFDETYLQEKYSEDIKKAIEYCEKYVLKFVREHKNVDFYIVIPPYSVVRYAKWYQIDRRRIAIRSELIRHFAKMSDSLRNLHVFGYDDEEFIKDISIYRDTIHYHPAINSLIARDISQNRHMLASDNVEAYLEKVRKTALDFDLRGFAQKVEDYLESKRRK